MSTPNKWPFKVADDKIKEWDYNKENIIIRWCGHYGYRCCLKCQSSRSGGFCSAFNVFFICWKKKKPVLKMIPTILFLYRYCYSNFHILMELEWLLKLYTCLFCFTHTHTKHQSWINCCAWMNHCVEMIQLSEWWFNYSFISCCVAIESVFLKEWKIHWLTHKNSCFSSPTGIRKLL